MSCPDCSSNSPLIFDVQSFINNSCLDCQQQNCLPVKYLCYTGPNLTCSGIDTGDTLEVALQKLDTQVCSAIGDYSTYQFHCLTAYWGSAITTESEFVDAITQYVCGVQTSLTTLSGTTFPAYQSTVNARVSSVESPSITCTSAGVSSGDTLTQILQKYCTKFGSIDTALNLSSVTWNTCFTVISAPTTLQAAFNLLVGQICTVKAIADAAAVLPVFNNTGSCLASPGASDSLVSTINKIKTRLCLTGTYDASLISWDCMTPGTTLQNSIASIVSSINTTQKILITDVSADFTLEATDPDDVCSGLTLSLATPLVNSDRLVASNVSDMSPGTLIQKLTAGTNLSLDDTTSPGHVIINATNDHLVKAGGPDDAPNTLVSKINGLNASGVSVNPSYNSGTKQLDIGVTADFSIFAVNMLNYINANPSVKALLCSIMSDCLDCVTYNYTVANGSGSAHDITWTICGGTTVTVALPNGDSMTVCAIRNSVSVISGVTVTEGAPCDVVPGTTTTTSAP